MGTALEVLKWMAIVFAAGVVGQFGKSLTLRLLVARRQRRQEREAALTDEGGRSPTPGKSGAPDSREPAGTEKQVQISNQELKIRKKALKAEVKQEKKRDEKK